MVRTANLARAAALSALLMVAANAWSLPSFAQQTGLPCASCHSIAFGPALTAYGREFKLNGYTWGAAEHSLPISLMTVAGYTETAHSVSDTAPHFDSNDNPAVNEVTAFYAGRITEHAGAFVEASYSGVERSTSWGAFDVRYARDLNIGDTKIVAGLSLNNNPTVTDLWNSTPVWGFPATASELAPTPEALPILFDGISERVMGPTLYTMIDDHLYLEAGAYGSLSDRGLRGVGLKSDDNLNMDGAAPYGRAALQFQDGPHYYSVGVFGLQAKLRPDPGISDSDRYRDVGVDATYQYLGGGRNSVNANLSFVHESRQLAASFAAGESDAVSNHLDTTHFDVEYAYEQTWTATLGWFDVDGSRNPGLLVPEEVSGSANGSPDSRGYAVQLEYVPFGKVAASRPAVNVRVGVQYIAYQRFNGGDSNYDGFGRSASDNDTVFAYIWLAL